MSKHAVVLLSGGLDSATLAYHLLAEGYALEALGVWYGQRHYRELDAAQRLANRLDVPLTVVRLEGFTVPGSVLTGDGPLPDAAPSDPAQRATVVPGRNAMLLSLAAAYAEGRGIGAVAAGMNLDDAAIYADCRPAYLRGLESALRHEADMQAPELLTPFVYWPKARVIVEGARLGVPFAETWSCYSAGETHCGWCGACRTRRAAFAAAGMTDPTEYAEVACPTA